MIDNKLTFVVERKSGTIPDIKWSKVFERELDLDTCRSSITDLLVALHDLFQGDCFRVIVYA
jgi:hypothetical protein